MEAEKDEIRISLDAMIALVVAEAEAREMATMPSLREMNEAFQPSERFLQRMDKLLRGVKNKERLRRWKKAAKRTALCAAVLLSVFSCMMLPVQAVREAVVTTLIKWHDEFITIVVSSDAQSSRALPETIELGYIPEGFMVEKAFAQDADSLFVKYADGLHYFSVRIAQLDDKQQISLDNEYTTYYSIQFDSHDALWGSREDGINLLTWNKNGFLCYMSGDLPLNELIKIAENIKI